MSANRSLAQSVGFKVAVFVVGTILLGAILSPLLYIGGKHVVAKGWIENVPVLESLHGSMDRAKFSRYFNRGILAGALLMLYPTFRWLLAGRNQDQEKVSLRQWMQLRQNRHWWQHLGLGFLLAGVPILILGWVYVKMGWYVPKENADGLLGVLFAALFTGFAVSFLEEFLFRGALTSIFSGLLKPLPLLLGIAIFFAIVHFLKPPKGADITEVTAWSGFHMLGLIFGHFDEPDFLAAFAVLFAIGLVLGFTRLKTQSLWLGIGLHAGWVFGAKTLGPMLRINVKFPEKMPWLGKDIASGLIATSIVCATGLIVWLWLRKGSQQPNLTEN